MNKLYLILLTFLLSTNVIASSVIDVTDQDQIWIGKSIEYLKDPTFNLTVDEVKNSNDWLQNGKKSLNFRDSDFAVWIKAKIINNADKHSYIQFQYPIIDTISYFLFQEEKLIQHNVFGSHFPFNKREFQSSLPTIKVPPGKTVIYIKAVSQLNLQLPLVVYAEEELRQDNNHRDFAQGLYTGILVLAILSALFIGLFTKDIIFYAYIGHVIGTGFITLHIGGYAFQYIWPEYPSFNIYEPWIFGLGIFSTLFTMAFLDTANRSRSLNRLLWISLLANFLVYPLLALGYIQLANQLVQMVGLLGCALMLVVGIIFLRRGHKEARFFILAWSFFLIGVIVTILERVSILPFNSFTLHASQIGSGIDVILLSVALADRINLIREEKNKAQKKALFASEQNRKLIENQNALLAEKVRNRTQELESLNAQKTRIFSIIGHDLRGPVGTIKQALEILVSNPETRTTEMLERLKESSASSFNLLENLLIWSRSNLNEIELERNMIKLQVLVEDIVSLIRLNAQAKNIELKANYESITVYSDERLLSAVLRNLIANAIKFTPEKGTISIEVKASNQNEEAIITITDTGVGIHQNAVDRIFDSKNSDFTSTQGTSGEKGTGLGLQLSREFCKKLDVTLAIESELNVGTKILLRVPTNDSN